MMMLLKINIIFLFILLSLSTYSQKLIKTHKWIDIDDVKIIQLGVSPNDLTLIIGNPVLSNNYQKENHTLLEYYYYYRPKVYVTKTIFELRSLLGQTGIFEFKNPEESEYYERIGDKWGFPLKMTFVFVDNKLTEFSCEDLNEFYYEN